MMAVAKEYALKAFEIDAVHPLVQEVFKTKDKLNSNIATSNQGGKPEAAVIEYGETDNFELIFDAFENSRKIQNIKKSNNVAFVIGWDGDITVQYEGQAFELEGDELQKYKSIYFRKNPEAQKWEKVESIRFYKVLPKWIRYSDLNKDSWEVFEVVF